MNGWGRPLIYALLVAAPVVAVLVLPRPVSNGVLLAVVIGVAVRDRHRPPSVAYRTALILAGLVYAYWLTGDLTGWSL